MFCEISIRSLSYVAPEQKVVFAVTTFYSPDTKADLVQGHAIQPFTQPFHFLTSRGLLGNSMLTLDLLQFIFLF